MAGRVGLDGDGVGGADWERGGEGEGAVRGDGEVVAAVVLQHDRAGQAADTVPPTVKVKLVQMTEMLVTLAVLIVPVPLVTVQVWPVGLVLTVTA